MEQEDGRLKKIVADRDVEVDVPKEITRKNGWRTRAGSRSPTRRDARFGDLLAANSGAASYIADDLMAPLETPRT